VQSDYEMIGGGRAVSAVVRDFYDRVLADPELAPFFEGIDMGPLRRHQTLLVSQVLGGPAEYDGRELAEAHDGLDIGRGDFQAVVVHLVRALEAAGVPDDIVGRVVGALAAHEKDVVTTAAT
jgi:hemoglobin